MILSDRTVARISALIAALFLYNLPVGLVLPVLTSTRRSFPSLRAAKSQEQAGLVARKISKPLYKRSMMTRYSDIAPTVALGIGNFARGLWRRYASLAFVLTHSSEQNVVLFRSASGIGWPQTWQMRSVSFGVTLRLTHLGSFFFTLILSLFGSSFFWKFIFL